MNSDGTTSSEAPVGSHDESRTVVLAAVVAFVGGALFPRLAHRLRWPTRLGSRGVGIYVLYKWIEIFTVRTWGPPLLKRFIVTSGSGSAPA